MINRAEYGMDVFVSDGVHEAYGKVAGVDSFGRFTVIIPFGKKVIRRRFYWDGTLVKRRGRGPLSKLKATLIL